MLALPRVPRIVTFSLFVPDRPCPDVSYGWRTLAVFISHLAIFLAMWRKIPDFMTQAELFNRSMPHKCRHLLRSILGSAIINQPFPVKVRPSLCNARLFNRPFPAGSKWWIVFLSFLKLEELVSSL